MSPIEFRRELVQYASAALTGILANRALTNTLSGSGLEAHVSSAAWKYAEAMCKAAPTESEIQVWRRQVEQSKD